MKEILDVLSKEKSYRRLVFANFISGIGDWFSSVAILSLLLQLTGSGLAVGITLAARTLPFLIMGPLSGYLSDRINKKIILVVSDFSRIFLALSLLLVNSESNIWIAYVVTVSLVVFSALSLPARQSLIPQIVRPSNIPVANSIDQSLGGINMTLGAASGGVVSALIGTQLAFIINAFTFLISGILVLKIKFSSKEKQYNENNEQNQLGNSFWKEFKESLLIKIVAIQALLWPIGGGAINVLISVYGYQVFQAGDQGVGILYAALGVGFLISGTIAHLFKRWMVFAVIFSTVIEGGAHIMVSQSSSLWTAALFILIATIGAGIGNASFTSLTMLVVPKYVHGRAFALSETTSNVTIALSMMITGVLLEFIPAQTIGFWAGAIIVCTSITALPLLKLKNSEKLLKASI
ncbi:MFS transporter [Virgibacillus salexigens]|uniref:MFS transporter n=1 Tax=Virgibacillus kapii TaxID=1638645 RepID=A0ABQ2DXT2_9BACI|nr:MFS transporter [Virgibacillus kapii]GGJ77782.1 MFS transporter [Virgibacillus kapii]